MSTPATFSHSTSQLIAWDRQFLWHPFTPMKPWCENKDILAIDRGDREFLIDTEGRRYIDGVSSLWCNIHGHCVPELDAAVRDQLAHIAHSTLLGLTNIPATLLAKRLVELAQSCGLNLTKVFYSDNGSTAVEVACKMAYQYWVNRGQATRTRFIAFQNSYHGDTLGAVSLGGIPLFHQAFKSLCFPVDFVPPPSTTGGSLQRTNESGPMTNDSVTLIDQLLSAHPDQYAALIIEPLVLGAGGMLMYSPTVLRQLRELADRHHTLLIFDEVLTAFGRTGKMFAAEHSSPVTPDLICLSKGLTAGYMPLGVTMTAQHIFDAFYTDPNAHQGQNVTKTFFHGHTFTGHPLACAIALASLDLFDKNHVLEHVQSLGPLIDSILAPLRNHPHVADVRRLGLIAAIDLVRNKNPLSPFPYYWRVGGELCTRMRAGGVLLRPIADTLIIMPPLAIRPENLQHLCNVVVQSLNSLPEIIAQKQQEFASSSNATLT